VISRRVDRPQADPEPQILRQPTVCGQFRDSAWLL